MTWRSDTGQALLYDNGRLVWEVVRGRGKRIPSGGTLVIGREQDCPGGCFDSAQGIVSSLAHVHCTGCQASLLLSNIVSMMTYCCRCSRQDGEGRRPGIRSAGVFVRPLPSSQAGLPAILCITRSRHQRPRAWWSLVQDFTGIIDEIRLWDHVRDPDQIHKVR